MTLIDCDEKTDAVSHTVMDNEPWQARAKRAGLSQKALARLLGTAENTVSRQLRGQFSGGVPIYVRTFIRAWEMLAQKDRDALVAALDEPEEGGQG